ncbi:MAG: HAMP domain-containing sensor histidine kinase [Parvularculaceae bacterium]|nr:HAMP domain-containing sensor histidine kinase [Parvularculaceae bacterium]
MGVQTSLEKLGRRLSDAVAGPAFRGGASAALAIVARDGSILSLGAGAKGLLGEAGRTRRFADLFHPDDRALIAAAVAGPIVRRFEARARRPGGGEGLVELIFERRDDDFWTVLMIDRPLAQARLAEGGAAGGEDQARDATAMLADLSHEMRTPLNAVIGFAETIERETFGPIGHPNYAQYAEHIRMAGRHLLDLVNVVLDLSRVEADRYRLARVEVDPAQIARECAGMLSQSAAAAGLKLRLDIADDLPRCRLDPRALRQILINLLSNAIKFTSDGEISLSVAARDGDIVFVVKDDGVGMSAQALRQIGARFTSAQGAGVRGQGGSGLGLSLAISLAELHGGVIDLASAPGEGLRAEVRLPIAEGPASSRGLVRAASDPSAPPQLTELDRIKARRLRAEAA